MFKNHIISVKKGKLNKVQKSENPGDPLGSATALMNILIQ